MKKDCIFCKIVAGELPAYKVYEDQNILAFLDINPINPGHTLVVSKVHSENIADTTEATFVDLIKVIKKIYPAVLNGVGAADANLTINSGKLAGQAVPHLHFHIIPRFAGDGHKLWTGKSYASSEVESIVQNIKNFIDSD